MDQQPDPCSASPNLNQNRFTQPSPATPDAIAERASTTRFTTMLDQNEQSKSVLKEQRTTEEVLAQHPKVEELGGERSVALETPQADKRVYASGLKLVVIITSLCLSMFLVALDNLIIATAIPRITNDFAALNDVGWYGSSYLLTTCAFQLLFGRLYSVLSVKWVYLFTIGIFELGSLICGAAPNLTAFVLGRAIAGVGAAGIFSGSLTIIVYTVTLRKRPIYQGVIGSMYGIASIAGPVMGGAFTDRVTWRLCFYINLPLGVVTIAGIAFFFKSPRRDLTPVYGLLQFLDQFDPVGTIVLIGAVVSLLLALQYGGSSYSWSNGRMIALFVVFGVLMIGFVGIQLWKKDNATVSHRVVRQRSMAFSSLFSITLGASFFLVAYWLPIWLQAIQGVSATESGIRTLPIILGLVVASIVAGIGTSILEYFTPFMILSSILMSVGAGLLTTFECDTSSSKWIGYQAIYGMGMGMGMQQAQLVAQHVLHPPDVPTGIALFFFFQTLGGAIATSVGQNIVTTRLIPYLAAPASSSIMPNIDPTVVLAWDVTSLRNTVPPEHLDRLIVAYNDAITRAFYASVAFSCISFVGSLI